MAADVSAERVMADRSSMAFASDIQLVRVRNDVFIDGIAMKQIWAAAVSRELAVALVLGEVPEGRAAALSKKRLTTREMALLKMRPGDVREVKKSSGGPNKRVNKPLGGAQPALTFSPVVGLRPVRSRSHCRPLVLPGSSCTKPQT